MLKFFYFAVGTSWKRGLSIPAADGQQLDQLFYSNVVSYQASNELFLVYTRTVKRFQSKQELSKRACLRLIPLSTYVALFCVPSSFAPPHLILANDDASNYIIGCWESFFFEPRRVSSASLSLLFESSTATNVAKINLNTSTGNTGESQQSFSSSSFETIIKQRSFTSVQEYNKNEDQ